MKSSSNSAQISRTSSGNTLALIAAISAGILILILLFALSYTRLVGSNQEQRTAVEAAALAAAKDVSRIVINDSNFGYVSISDAAPIGKATAAGDNYFMPVNGINTLMGTIRLDLIIADSLGNLPMKALAKRDLANLKLAKENLAIEIRQALTGAGSSKDIDGNPVNPYTSAEAAYNQNLVRMSGNATYVPNSMKLTLGSISAPMQTNVPTPKPASYANVEDEQAMNGFYMSGMNVPYDGEDFVFAAVGDSLKLVDPTKFTETLGSVPYQMHSVIKAEADQKIQDQADKSFRTVHAQTCAATASVYDPKPAPGSLTVSFPDQMPPEISSISTILSLPGMNTPAPIDIKKSINGDYPEPGSSLTPNTWGGGGTPNGSTVASGGYYDWMRRSGARLNADQAVKLLTEPLTNTGVPAIHIFSVKPDGTIQYNYDPTLDTAPYWVASENQMYGVALDALASTNGNAYDVHIRDYGYQPGTINGGKHGGEPLKNSQVVVPIAMLHPGQTIATVASARLEIASNGKSGTIFGGDCGGGGDGATWNWIGNPPPGPPTKVTINGVNYKIWPNATGGAAGLVRNDFGLPGGLPLVQFLFGPAGGLDRPTYLQNGAVVDIRFRHAIPFVDPVDGSNKKGYKTKKNDPDD